MIAKSGVKVLDFGLAKFADRSDSGSELTATMTAPHVIVGTLAYLAPEQLEGKQADARSDIWALGCVLYEALSQEHPFRGSTTAAIMSSVLRDQPKPLEGVPAQLERVVKTCLAKDPEERFQTARDLKRALEWAADAAVPPNRRVSVLPWAVAAALALIALTISLVHYRGSAPKQLVTRLSLNAPGHAAFEQIAVSPDGRRLAFTCKDSAGKLLLWVRSFDGDAPDPWPTLRARGVRSARRTTGQSVFLRQVS